MTGARQFAGKWPDYVEWWVEMIQGEGGDRTYRPMSRRTTYDESLQGYVQQDATQGHSTRGDFDVDVTSGTSLPFMKQQRSDQAQQLFQMKAIDQTSLLDVLDWPEKEKVEQRMDKQQQETAQQSSQQPQPAAQG